MKNVRKICTAKCKQQRSERIVSLSGVPDRYIDSQIIIASQFCRPIFFSLIKSESTEYFAREVDV